jgi:hypothetical protein
MSVTFRLTFAVLALVGSFALAAAQDRDGKGRSLDIRINPSDRGHAMGIAGLGACAIQSGDAAKVNGNWLHPSEYPRRDIVRR